MKWYKSKLFYLAVLALVLIVAGTLLALLDKVTGQQALSFFGGPVVGVVIGYLAGKLDGRVGGGS